MIYQTLKFIFRVIVIAGFLLVASHVSGNSAENSLPVLNPEIVGLKRVPYYRIHNILGISTIRASIKSGNKRGLEFDLTGEKSTLNGKELNPEKIYGNIYAGPYPFESKEVSYTYKRFKTRSVIKGGRGFINISYMFEEYNNSEGWTDSGEIYVRFELFLETEKRDRRLGEYEIIVRFQKVNGKFVKLPSLVEGPFVNKIHSDDPSSITIAFKTDTDVIGKVNVKGKSIFSENKAGEKHEIVVDGLTANTIYRYSVGFNEYKSKVYEFKTAPLNDDGKFIFVYTGDSRSGTGYKESSVMGVNYRTLERIANISYLAGAEFILQGGDMINGRTTGDEDFRTQMYSWRNCLSGFWHERPVYTCQGNHESIVNVFKNGYGYIKMDKWPYKTKSTESVFADELVHFENAPAPSDPRRPTYRENVYSFRYGQVKFIVFNNNYWLGPVKYGGLVEGYILDDQLDWIKKELDEGEKDIRVKFIILFAQEPVFPNGGHIQDSMWYLGDNSIRGSHYCDIKGKVIPEKKGIIEVRNKFVRMIANNSKVAAVLGSDEHGYHKVLIDKSVPIGKASEKKNFSPLNDLKYPTWYIVSGGAGAPYYAEEPTPWNGYWKNNKDRSENKLSSKGCYYYSSQENFFLFKVEKGKIAMDVITPYGEKIDSYPDLMILRKK